MKKLRIFASVLFLFLIFATQPALAEMQTKIDIQAIQQAAERGDIKAQVNLGLIYFRGDGALQDKVLGARWLLKAAEQGNAEAQRYVGWMYVYGEGLEKNNEQAVLWYKKSAEQGDPQAQGNLARRYLRGEGVTQDYRQALSWFTKAAEKGDAVSQYDLGIMYMTGEGVKPDVSVAREWFKKSADQGFEEAKKALAYLEIEDVGDKHAEQRKTDVYFIASLLEEYKSKVGHYPFFDPRPAENGYVKVGRLVAIGSQSAEQKLEEKPNPFGLSVSRAFSVYLAYELEKVLKRPIKLPVDPQETDLYAPNAYYVYLLPEDDDYLVMAFLYSPEQHTSKLWNKHANVYAVASSEKVGNLNFWKSAGIKPQIYREMKRTNP